jgi:hypothetical protein
MTEPQGKYFWRKQMEEEKQEDQNKGGYTVLRII